MLVNSGTKIVHMIELKLKISIVMEFCIQEALAAYELLTFLSVLPNIFSLCAHTIASQKISVNQLCAAQLVSAFLIIEIRRRNKISVKSVLVS